MSERFFTTSLLASIEKNFSYLALSSHMPVQKTVAHPSPSIPERYTENKNFSHNFSFFSENFFLLSQNGGKTTSKFDVSREERLEEKLCEKMSLFCLFSLFVMGQLFLRKVKFYVRNVSLRKRIPPSIQLFTRGFYVNFCDTILKD